MDRTREAQRLAELVVEETLARPAGELVDPALAAVVLRAFVASDGAEARVAAWLRDRAALLAVETRTLEALLPAPLARAARELLELPLTPRRELVMKVADRPPVRKLLRAQVLATLVDFARKAASPITDNPIARGVGGLLRKPGGGSRFGSLGSAISGEVERQTEKRAAEFADTAVFGVLSGLADDLSDASRARDQADVRGAVLEGVLALTPAETMEPLRDNLTAATGIIRRALTAWSASATFEAELATVAAFVLGKGATRPLGEVLAELGVRDVVTAQATSWLAARLAGPLAKLTP